MNVKEKIKASSKKIIAGTLAAVTAASSLPLQSFAENVVTYDAEPLSIANNGIATIAAGQTKYSQFGKKFTLSGGASAGNDKYYYVQFDENGQPSTAKLHTSTDAASWLILTDEKNPPVGTSGVGAICIETGADFANGEKYVGYSVDGSKYWEGLQTTIGARATMIALTGYYGYNGVKWEDSAVSNATNDDWAVATQVLTWELQQGLRLAPTGSATSSTGMNTNLTEHLDGSTGEWVKIDYDNFRSRLATDATKAVYNKILQKVNSEAMLPSFCDALMDKTVDESDLRYSALNYEPRSEANYATVTMKWNGSQYVGTIKDTNGTNRPEDFSILTSDYKDDTITVKASKSGSTTTYTFSCDKATGDKIGNNTVTMGKTASDKDKMTIYEPADEHYQTVIVGGYDPVSFGVKVTTEKEEDKGSFRIVKEFEGGTPTTDEIAQVAFKVTNAQGQYVNASAQATTGAGRGIYTYTSTGGTGTTFYINGSSHAFKISDLPTGTYTVTETSKLNNWKNGAAVNVTVTVDGTAEKTYTNTHEDDGSLRVEKQFSGGTPTIDEIKEVEFIVKTGDNKNYVIATKQVPDSTQWGGIYTYSKLTTNRDAATRFHITGDTHAFSISNMPTDTYDIWETAHPSNWTPQSDNPIQDVSVTNDEPKEVEFENDKDGGTGAVMKLFSGGSVTAEEYAACKFTLKASDGKYVRATATQQVGFYTFSGFSTTAQEFSLHTTYPYVVDIDDLPVGTYTFTETKSPDGWTAEPSSVKVVVTKDETSTANITNTKDTASLHVTKRFVGDNAEMIPAGAERTHLLFRFIWFPIRKIAFF